MDSNNDNRQSMIREHLPLVHRVVRHMGSKAPNGMDYEDLVAFGTIGLIEAVDRFDGTRGHNFAAFAAPRIRGAIIDQLRVMDPLSRHVRRHVKEIERSAVELTQALGRTPTRVEIARAAGIDPEQYYRATAISARVPVSLDAWFSSDPEGDGEASMDDRLADPNGTDFTEHIEEEELLGDLARAVEGLPERERLVVSLRFYEGLTLREIAEIFNVSETRVSQLCARAVSRLRSKIAGPAPLAA